MGIRIPVTPEIVDECNKCNPSACCMGNLVIQLTQEEVVRMTNDGTELHVVVPPASYERKDAIYPVSYDLDEVGVSQIYVERGRETEPLAPGFGRYIMLGACINLKTDPLGRSICAIYEDRPQACADFEAGSDKCHVLQSRLQQQATD